MGVFSAEYLRQVGIDLFTACGAPREEAVIVADELVNTSLMGIDSHGVVRYIQYAEDVLKGKIEPGAPMSIVKETPTTAIVDCGLNFGLVTATRMVEIVCDKAKRNNVACVVSRNSQHVGRLGAHTEKIARLGLFGFATANSSKHGHWVVPWSGREGRLATNPLSWAAPTSDLPVVMDMSTAAISEGKIRVLMHDGRAVPPDSIQDAAGNPTQDPKAFYGPPRGTILPFGGQLGYKGTGLSLLVEVLGALLAGEATSMDHPYINGLCLMAVAPEAFCGKERFIELMDDLCEYITSSPSARGAKVTMPGALDYRTREKRLVEGIPLADESWLQIVDVAKRVGVTIHEPDGERSQS